VAALRPASKVRRELQAIAESLSGRFGIPRRRATDPLDELIQTVLSQNTSDVNSDRAFRSLKRAFPSWGVLSRARPSAIEAAIRVGGLARLKSGRILGVLREVRRREGRHDLRRLRRLGREEARRSLEGLSGVGPKTRSCVLLFACRQPAFPVDTHIHRIMGRLGLVPAGASAEKTQALLEPHVPEARALDLHLNLIRLGREVCRPGRPLCQVCPLRRRCAYARAASWAANARTQGGRAR
jgi:endonuclease-3